MKARCLAACLLLLVLGPPLVAQETPYQPELVLTVESKDPVVTAALSSDGRLAYATTKTVPYGPYREQLQRRAEVFVLSLTEGKPKRIVSQDYIRDPQDPYENLAFSVARIAWSPDATRLAVEITPHGHPTATFLFKSAGGRLNLRGGGNLIPGYTATWLADSSSLLVLEEAAPPRLLHSVLVVRVEAGRGVELFPTRTFAALAALPGKLEAVLVERDKDFAQPPAFTLGDLESGKRTSLGADADFLGGLRATPDKQGFSYFVGQNKLVVRKLTGEISATVNIPFSSYEWLPAGAVIFLEPEKPGRATGWLSAWDPKTQKSARLLPDQRIREFWISPDGTYVAVLGAEDGELKVYRLPETLRQ